MISSLPTDPRQNRMRRCHRPGLRVAAAILAAIGLVGWTDGAAASLLGAQVSYRSLFPNTNTVLNNLGTQTVTPLTTFNDTKNGLTSFFIGQQLVVENTSTDRNSRCPPAA